MNIETPTNDTIYGALLDSVKLLELKEHDNDLYRSFRASLASKYGGAAGGDDDE